MSLSNYEKALYSSNGFIAEPEGVKITNLTERSDPQRAYRKNSNGFRGPDFVENAEILVAGCSMTYGVGISEESTWPSILASNMGHVGLNVLAKPGKSIGWIVEHIFKYFQVYGHPKYLLCLFPDYERHYIPVDNSFYIDTDMAKNGPNNNHDPETLDGNGKFFRVLPLAPFVKEKGPRYIKLPQDYARIFSRDICIKESTKSIRYLEQYCKLAGIHLLWSSWDGSLLEDLKKVQADEDCKFYGMFDFYGKKMNTYLKSSESLKKQVFFDDRETKGNCLANHQTVECECYLTCHEEYRTEEHFLEFDNGTDVAMGVHRAHPGKHWHIHCAETFMDAMLARGWGTSRP